MKRSLAGRHLVEQDAEREHIGAPVEVLALELFGRHVGQRSQNSSFAVIKSVPDQRSKQELHGRDKGQPLEYERTAVLCAISA